MPLRETSLLPQIQCTPCMHWWAVAALMVGLTSCALPPLDEEWAGVTPMERMAGSSQTNEKAAALPNTRPAQVALASTTARPVQSPQTISLDNLAQQKRLPYRTCIEQALRHNLKANIARLTTDATALEEDVARALLDPAIRLNGITYPGTGDEQPEGNVMMKKKFLTGAELRAEVGTAFTNNTDRGLDFSTNTTEHAIRLTQPLLRGAGIAVNRAPMDLAKISTASAGAMARAEVMEVLRATESAYWTAVWAKESLRVQNDSLARSRQVEAEVRERHRLGAANKIDQLEAQAAVSASLEQVERASQRFKDAVSNLTYLLGLVPGDVPDELSFESLRLLTQTQIDAEAHYQQALRLNPQEVLLANEIERWTIESKVARNSILPAVNLEISHGTNNLIGYSPRSSADQNSKSASPGPPVPSVRRRSRQSST
jgi:outer membrane protein TolC